MKVAPKRSVSTVRAREEASHRSADIVGILVIAAGVLLLLSLRFSDTGIVGNALQTFARTLFGSGSLVFSLAIMAIGFSILTGRRRHDIGTLTCGISIIYLAILGMLSGASKEMFDPQLVLTSGGYVGAIVGWLFKTLFGSAKLVGLGALSMIGVVMCLSVPIRSLGEYLRRPRRAIPERGAKPVAKGEVAARAVVQAQKNGAAEVQPTVQAENTRKAPIIRDTQRLGGATLESIPKEGYQLPPLSLLAEPEPKVQRSQEEMQRVIDIIESTLEQFGIEANVVEVATGATVTRYEIQLGPGIRVGRLTALADNIALNLAVPRVRFETPIPGKSAVGIEVPNSVRSTINMREVCQNKEFLNHPSRLAVALGQDIGGANVVTDLTRMPHLLIGGTTNSGKSIGMCSIVMSLLMRNTPKDLKMVLIDPKRVEFTLFDGIPHLLCPVVTDVKEAPGVLRAIWREMDRRYDLFSKEGVRNIESWNKRASFQDRLSYIVVLIDELADMMMQSGPEVETAICRIAQLARATGIHLVIATQRPDVKVITGTIKANIGSRIGYSVMSHIDSRTILDQSGAEKLLGRGDMLFLPIDAVKPQRIQSPYVSEAEIHAVCEFWRKQEKPSYTLKPIEASEVSDRTGGGGGGDETDPLWEDAVRFVIDRGQASTSMLQRRFSIGFQRASRLLDMMEERGIVGQRDGSRPREVLVDPLEVDELFGGGRRGPSADPGPEPEEDE